MDVLSFGGGRQTVGMLALMKLGRLDIPDAIIFADTGDEHPDTYKYSEEISRPLIDDLGVKFVTVRNHNKPESYNAEYMSLYDHSWHYNFLPQPFQRSCTDIFKIRPIYKYLDQFRPEPINVWIGISADESHRAKASRKKWVNNVFHLLDHNLTRSDCQAAIVEAGLPLPPKSGCFYCPFQPARQWIKLKAHHPDLVRKAIELEEHVALTKPNAYLRGHNRPLRRFIGEGYQTEFEWDQLLEDEAGCSSGYCFV